MRVRLPHDRAEPRLRFHGIWNEVTIGVRGLRPGQHPKRRDHSAVSKASSHRRFSSRPCRCDTTRTRRVHLRAIAHGWHFQPLCAIVRFVPQGDLCRLAEQKRAAAEEMRRIARTLWFCTDRNRVMRRAASELEAEIQVAVVGCRSRCSGAPLSASSPSAATSRAWQGEGQFLTEEAPGPLLRTAPTIDVT